MRAKIVSRDFIKRHLPQRSKFQNKTHGGKLLIIGGSEGMYGAAILSALAATRSGAGYTYILMDWKTNQLLTHPDLLFLRPSVQAFKSIAPACILIGPGLGKSLKARKWLTNLSKNKSIPIVLDADGLNCLATSTIKSLSLNWILTPHEGELARLLKIPSVTIHKDPIKYALMASRKWNCIVLLKGPTTYITDGKHILSTRTGTPALAKAGTGDVLSGIIAALLSQGLDNLTAGALGAYIHGLASRHWLKDGNDVLSLRPLDLIEALPKTIKAIRR